MGHYMDVKIQSTWVCVTEKKDLSGGVEEWGVDQQLISKLKEQYQRERQIGKKGMQSMLAFLFSCSLACCLVPCVCPPPVSLPCHMFLDNCTPCQLSATCDIPLWSPCHSCPQLCCFLAILLLWNNYNGTACLARLGSFQLQFSIQLQL